MRMRRSAVARVLTLALGLYAVGVLRLEAHHSFAAEYDGTKPITVTGAVTKIDWTNPHIYLYIDVKNETGAITSWKFEGYPPNMLIRQGWKRDETLKPGDTITVFGWRSHIDANLAAARNVTFADGHKLAAGPPAGTGGQ
jgi:uncharacterized protein DUF6152